MDFRKLLSLKVYKNIILHPVESFYRIRYRLANKWVNRAFSSYDDFFSYEQKNNFSYTKLKGRVALGVNIDLDNPRTFNEKLIHRRLFSRDPIWPIITDKIAVRNWLKEQGFLEYVNLVPARVAYSVEELLTIPIDKPVVVKAAWASGMNLFVSSNEELLKYKSTLEKWMNSPYAVERLVWAPQKMKRGFLVEYSIADEEGNVPLDYKFFCFNGKPEFMQVSIKENNKHFISLYSKEGSLLNYGYEMPMPDKNIHLDSQYFLKLKDIASLLCGDFSFIRVDLYFWKGKIFFGELTQTPTSGYGVFSDSTIARELGNLWEYPNSNKLGDKLFEGEEVK